MHTRLIFTFLVVTVSSASFAGTGFLKGEEVSGLNKVCYYEGASGSFSATVGAATLCPLSADDGRSQVRQPSYPTYGGTYSQPRQVSSTGFLSGQRVSGLNKICFYDGPRGTFTKTVGAAQICPVTATQ